MSASSAGPIQRAVVRALARAGLRVENSATPDAPSCQELAAAMKFAIQVGGSPYQHQSCHSAYCFARAVLARGHAIDRVFFYHDAVHVASNLATPPQDELDLTAAWTALAREHGLDLVVCVAAAQRRGIVDEQERQRHGKHASNIAEGFRIAGLGQLVEAALDADRLVAFGA